MPDRPDIIILMTDEERAIPPYEPDDVRDWRQRTLTGRRWFDEHGVNFTRHYTGSLACVPSRPTIFTGQYPDLHGVTQTDGIGKRYDDSRLRWLRQGEVPTLGNWFRAAGMTPTTTASGTSPTQTCTTRPPGNRWPPMTTTASSMRPPCNVISRRTR